MGQISVPVINKTGYSMYWSSMWDNKFNYSRFLKEDIYIRKFIPVLLEDNISLNFKNKNCLINFSNLNTKYNMHMHKDWNKTEIYNYINGLNKSIFYTSKIWVLRYQSWILIFFYIYSPSFNKLLKKIDFSESNVNDSISHNIFLNYYNSLVKLNYNYSFYKKSLKKTPF
jgi:hypothetical protein